MAKMGVGIEARVLLLLVKALLASLFLPAGKRL